VIGLQILVDGFAISALYALGAMGFTLIFGVSGVLNLTHGALMVMAAVAAWAESVANGKVKFPAFVKVQAAAN
jgi:branched-chain amino acid transport system permease protein